MRNPFLPTASLLILAALGCRSTAPRGGPEWLHGVPAKASVAVSGRVGWIVDNPQFQQFIARYPLADQTLDLFLKRARISPAQETGRITLVILGTPRIEAKNVKAGVGAFLIQMSGFRDNQGLVTAMSEAFPLEGSLRIHGKDCPLHVVMDVNDIHIRATVDDRGRIWVGELSALAGLDQVGSLDPKGPQARAAEWINPDAPVQGLLQPKAMLEDLQRQIPDAWKADVPRDVDGLAWSLTPSRDPKAPHRLELAVTGGRQSINQLSAWLQRLVAAATAIQSAGGAVPEILQEPTRVGLKAQFTDDQIKMVMDKLGQPAFTATRPAGSPAAPR